ncbi:MAG: DUF1801 domain-containing protein [Acholeplasma sp.]|nr:DUF1801 domain-containing protein [Acholeplasma sp.]
MIEAINDKLSNYDDGIKDLFESLRSIIFEIEPNVEERMWAGLPSYYKGNNFIRLIPFKTYINIEARSTLSYVDELKEYKITPKGMLKITSYEQVSRDLLGKIFLGTLA